MKRTVTTLLIYLTLILPVPMLAMQDQGLSSIMSIIDRAIEEFNNKVPEQEGTEEERKNASEAASSTIVNLSRTLGNLSYSRLQCGQADVLAEFTQRVQKMPQDVRDSMRDAFQQGFDNSKAETSLLSVDECERLTQSRNLGDKKVDVKIKEQKVKNDMVDKKSEKKTRQTPASNVDPMLKQLRIAELTGQLAYRRKYCGDSNVVSRDFNEVIGKMPEAFQDQAKKSYWKGYKRGKRLTKNLSQCQ